MTALAVQLSNALMHSFVLIGTCGIQIPALHCHTCNSVQLTAVQIEAFAILIAFECLTPPSFAFSHSWPGASDAYGIQIPGMLCHQISYNSLAQAFAIPIARMCLARPAIASSHACLGIPEAYGDYVICVQNYCGYCD